MAYRIVASILLVAVLAGAVILSEGESSPASAPASTSAGSDDSAMKSLRIDQ